MRWWSSGFPNLPFSPVLPSAPFSSLSLPFLTFFSFFFTLFPLFYPFSLFPCLSFSLFPQFSNNFPSPSPIFLFSIVFLPKKTFFPVPFPPFSGQSDASLCNFLASFVPYEAPPTHRILRRTRHVVKVNLACFLAFSGTPDFRIFPTFVPQHAKEVMASRDGPSFADEGTLVVDGETLAGRCAIARSPH